MKELLIQREGMKEKTETSHTRYGKLMVMAMLVIHIFHQKDGQGIKRNSTCFFSYFQFFFSFSLLNGNAVDVLDGKNFQQNLLLILFLADSSSLFCLAMIIILNRLQYKPFVVAINVNCCESVRSLEDGKQQKS